MTGKMVHASVRITEKMRAQIQDLMAFTGKGESETMRHLLTTGLAMSEERQELAQELSRIAGGPAEGVDSPADFWALDSETLRSLIVRIKRIQSEMTHDHRAYGETR